MKQTVLSAILIILVITGIAWAAGIRVNFTPSYPRGLWIETGTAIKKGAYVLACIDDVADFGLYKRREYLPLCQASCRPVVIGF